MESLGIIGFGNKGLYRCLARRVTTNTAVFLAMAGLVGPYILQCFGISLGILQLGGGLVLAGMGWRMLHKEEDLKLVLGNEIVERDPDETHSYWTARAFYPLTYPITVGPCSLTVMLIASLSWYASLVSRNSIVC